MIADLHTISSWVSLRTGRAIQNGNVFCEDREASLPDFLKRLYKELQCDYPKFYKMDNLSKLGFIATELLLKGRNLSAHYPPDEVALVFSNASASLDTDAGYFKSVADKANYFPSPAVFVYTLPNIVMGEICIRHQWLGENTFFISEKFDAGLLAGYTQQLLSSGKAKCVLVGWIEIGSEKTEAVIALVEPVEGKAGRVFSQEALESIYHELP